MAFMLSHVVTSGVNFNQIESVHQKWRFKTQPPTQVQIFVSNHKRFIWLPTRGIQVVTLQVQEVQLQVVAIDLHMANFMWFRPFFMVIDDKGGEEWTKIWIILGWQRERWDESAIVGSDNNPTNFIFIIVCEFKTKSLEHTCRGSYHYQVGFLWFLSNLSQVVLMVDKQHKIQTKLAIYTCMKC